MVLKVHRGDGPPRTFYRVLADYDPEVGAVVGAVLSVDTVNGGGGGA